MNASASAASIRAPEAGGRRWKRFTKPALSATAAFWLAVALIGQLLFAAYVVGFYGRTAVQGRWQEWNSVLQAGYIRGDHLGNAALSAHLLLAVALMLSGAAQLVPRIRKRLPRLHRWNGRLFLASAAIASVTGLFMVWTRNTAGDLSQHLGISLNALLILGFAGLALHHARTRRFDVHRLWALRLFIAVNGVWFFRVGLMFWIVANHGPVGFDPKTFTGPFLTFLSFATYIVPLTVLELYFRAQRSRHALGELAMAAGLACVTLAMAVGIAAAFALLWLPYL